MTRGEIISMLAATPIATARPSHVTIAQSGDRLSTPGAPGIALLRIGTDSKLADFQDVQAKTSDTEMTASTGTVNVELEPYYFHRSARDFTNRGKQGATLNFRVDQTSNTLAPDTRLSWGIVYTLVKGTTDDLPSAPLSDPSVRAALRKAIAVDGVLSLTAALVTTVDNNVTGRTFSTALNKILGVTQSGSLLTSLFSIPATQVATAIQFANLLLNLIGTFGPSAKDEVHWNGGASIDLALTRSAATQRPNSARVPEKQTNWIITANDASLSDIVGNATVRLHNGVLEMQSGTKWSSSALDNVTYMSFSTAVFA